MADVFTPGAAHRGARVELARACRVMAHTGVADEVLGHVSLRLDADRALLRCRGPEERGLRFTTPADIRLVDLSGHLVDGGEAAGYAIPAEAPIHLATLRARPHLRAVVHSHPRAVVAASLLDRPLVPLYGSYDIPAARIAAAGIGVYPRSVLIRDDELASRMLEAMGAASVCVLRGHGLVTGGATVAEATLAAISVTRLCEITLDVLSAGGDVRALPDDEIAALPDLGPALNVATRWRFQLASLAADGRDLTPDEIHVEGST